MIKTTPRVQNLIKQMTLDEKITQLTQILSSLFSADGINEKELTGVLKDIDKAEKIMWNVGSVISNATIDADWNKELQKNYLKHNRLGIPLLFMSDIIHGYRTCFPIPLALSCAFDEEPAYNTASIAAAEARPAGVHVTFSPMLDLSRDPRWGRVAEGPGEDPFLGELAARAFVTGYQGEDCNLKSDNHIASTLKHFAGYGFGVGGRDYEETDISEHTMRGFVLKAFKSGIKAGAQLVMSAFTTFKGVPVNGSVEVLNKILRQEMGFDGIVISDFGSVGGIEAYGVAAGPKMAAQMALDATCDIDMMSFTYQSYLNELVTEGTISEEQLNAAVARILMLKEKLGLFDDPYLGISKEKTEKLFVCKEHREKARDAARKSIVMLKNNGVLPLSKDIKTVAVIGPNGGDAHMNGCWAGFTENKESVKIFEGIKNKLSDAEVIVEKGCDFVDGDPAELQRAIEAAKKADAVILAIGEKAHWSGECCSSTNLEITPVQMNLAREVIKANKNTVVTLNNGRPLALCELSEIAPAILECWFLGTEAGNAIADVIFGDYNPTGRLAMSFPRNVGQVPTYYNRIMTSHHNSTGSPNVWFQLRYEDCSILPLYDFGYGLSYTEYEYSDLKVPNRMKRGEKLTVSVKVKNIGKTAGRETLQLYIRDLHADIIRPMKELKALKYAALQPGEEQTVTFEIDEEMLKYHHRDFGYSADSGEFTVYIGHDSTVSDGAVFTLE